MGFYNSFFLFFVLGWLLTCGDVQPNPGPRVRPDVRILYSNIRGLAANLAELTVASADFDVLCLSETLVTDRRHISELRIPGFGGPQQRLAVARLSRGLALYVRSGCLAFRQSGLECSCHEVMAFRICGPIHNFYVFSVYRSPNGDDSIFDCLLAAMGKVQESDPKSAVVFVGDFNAHHTEWLNSHSPTNSSGRAARDMCNLSGCSQLVTSPTHIAGNTLDLVITEVPDVVDVSVGTPLGTSDHCCLNLHVTVNQSLPSYDVRRTVFLKNRVNWDRVREDVQDIAWSEIFKAQDPVSALNTAVSCIITRNVPTATLRFRSGDAPWFNADCRRVYDLKQTAYRAWTRGRTRELWLVYQRRRVEAEAVYDAAKSHHFNRSREALTCSGSSHRWWATLKSALFGDSSSLPALKGPGGRLVSSPAEKAELLSSHFDSKQSREEIDLAPICFPEPRCSSFAFRSSYLLKLLSDLDEHGGVDPVGCFPLFYKKVADILSPRLARIFRMLIRSGSFPVCWRVANITAIPKEANSPNVSDYRPISITPILSKVFEKLLSRRLSSFAEAHQLFPTRQFSYRKNYGCSDALLVIAQHAQQALDAGRECRLVQIDFSAAFDRVNHLGLLYKLQCFGIGGSILSIIRQFLSGRKQAVVVDGSSSSLVDVVSGVPQGSVLGPLLFILYTSEMFSITENILVGYADDSTLIADISRPASRPDVEASLLRDLNAIQLWCANWGMLLNPGKTKSLVISRSRAVVPPHASLSLNGVRIEDHGVLRILGVDFDSKLTFEEHIRGMVSSIARKIGLLRLSRRVFDSVDVVRRCFFAYLLPCLEYCSVVWGSAAPCHLALLDKVVRDSSRLCGEVDLVALDLRRNVAALCVFYKIYNNANHPLCDVVSLPSTRQRLTRAAVNANRHEVGVLRCRTVQFGRCFVPSVARLWNSLPDLVFEVDGLECFKRATNRWLAGL